MADIIGSQKKDSQKLMNDFKELVKDSNEKFQDFIASPLTITLGDEFQEVLKNIETATKIIIFFEEESIHKKLFFKLRYVIKEGEIDT